MPSLIDLMLEGRQVQHHSPWPRSVVDASIWKFAASELAQGRWSLLGLWGEPSTVHMAIMDEQTAEIAVVSLDCPDRAYPSVSQHHPPAFRLERAVRDLFGLVAEGSSDTRPWLDHNRWGSAVSIRRSHRCLAASVALSLSCRRKATACTRLQSVLCMPASLSLGISALRRAGKLWFVWNSGWDMRTKVSRG